MPSQQHRIMIEAVENHMPEVIVIDEIGTEEEALAARTISQRCDICFFSYLGVYHYHRLSKTSFLYHITFAYISLDHQ